MEQMPMAVAPNRFQAVFGAALLIVCALQFVVAERVAAAAWVRPPYNYARNYISDLGITACGVTCSPLHWVVNASFVLLGMLFLAATVLLVTFLPARERAMQVLLAVLYAIGLTTVAAIPAQPQSGGLVIFHAVGALVALLASNYSLVRIGVFAPRLQAPQGFPAACIVLGSVGILGTCLFAIPSPALPRAIFERAGTYPFLLGCVITGIAILYSAQGVTPRRLKKSQT